MQIGVLGNEGSWYCAEIERAATARGHHCRLLDFRLLLASNGFSSGTVPMPPRGNDDQQRRCSESELLELDALIVRTMAPGSLEQVVFRMNMLSRVEAAGVLVINPPRAVECAVDKYLTTARLEAAGLPVPRTVTCQDTEAAMSAFDALGGDLVVKPLFGAEGRGICRVSDPDLAFRTFRTLERLDAVLYLQEFIDHPGFDTRVMVLNNRVIGGMQRFGNNDFRTNIARQGRGEPHTVTAEEAELALQAASATGAWFAGIDLLQDKRGRRFVIEVNAVPGWKGFTKSTGIDVVTLLLAEIESVKAARRKPPGSR